MTTKNMSLSGIYVIELKKPAFGLASGSIIYIGKGNDVEKRLKQELGIKSGPATFFRSVGVLLGKTVKPGSGKNFDFYERKEIANWINEYTKHTVMKCDWRGKEKALIQEHKPPLNIMYNKQHCLPNLVELRKKAKEISMRPK
jgi:GIY-YIG catalytic domain-containing protein